MLIPGVRAHDYGKDTPAALFAKIAADGFTTMQLAISKALQVTDPASMLPDIQSALAENNLSVGVLGSYVEPGHGNEEIRQDAVKTFCENIPVAAALRAGCIGTETTHTSQQPPGVTKSDALRNLRKSLEAILPVAEEHKMIVGIEPVYYHTLSTPELTKELLRDMKSPWLKVIYDPVNLLSPELIPAQHALWNRAMDCFGNDVVAVHMKGVQLADGKMIPCSFQDSLLDYADLFEDLNQLSGTLPLLREEVQPASGAADLAFFKKYIAG